MSRYQGGRAPVFNRAPRDVFKDDLDRFFAKQLRHVRSRLAWHGWHYRTSIAKGHALVETERVEVRGVAGGGPSLRDRTDEGADAVL